MQNEIVDYYAHFDEHSRTSGESIERERTQELISRHLQGSGLRILDIGGATGVYSFWLAARGHEVHLVDLSPRHVEQARAFDTRRQLASIEVGDARDLRFADGTFDVVLLFGPLYHLTDRDERLEVLTEAIRVMKPGANLFGAAISRYASMIDGFQKNLISDPDFIEIMNRDLENGQHRNPTGKDYFTTAFFHLPEELEEEFIDAGLESVTIYAVESVSELLPDLNERMRDQAFREVMLETIRRIECDRSFLGMTSHLLAVGQKS